ncbi:hypothetical protein [uncultured Eubacterium sp.]|uniref:hypothetical protein n=1 Tax=uncultured Eubacterium sp. TaxID=165185 RepID=UPI002612F383|nr:hypothetical protein [uncultured Eubacterium sp.]
MKYDDFKNSLDFVKPDAHLQTRLKAKVEGAQNKTKKSKKPVILGLVSVMALAVVVTGLGVNDLIGTDKVITSDHSVSAPTQSDSATCKVAPGFVNIVYANDKKSYAMDVSEISVESPPYCQIGAWSIKGKSEAEINDMREQIHKDFELVKGFVGENEVYFSTAWHIERMDNALVYSAYCGAFDFDLSEDDYAKVKEIRVTNSNKKYGEMEIVAEDSLFDENLKRIDGKTLANADELENIYIKNRNTKYASLSGDRFRRCMKLEKNNDARFRINWKMSNEFYELFDENPDVDLTKIKDTLTFEVVFNDDSVSKSVVDITFDKNGNMKAKPASFQYIHN